MRVLVVATAAALLAVGCGAGEKEEGAQATERSSLRSLWKRPGLDVGLTMGTSEYVPGDARLSFLVLTRDGRPIYRPRARVWIASALDAKPFARTVAHLEPVGVHGGHGDDHDHGITHLYVAHMRLPRPATYWLLAEPVGGAKIQGVGNVVVRAHAATPSVGALAIASSTPTLSDAVDASELTTRVPPDRALLRYSVRDSLRAHEPFVLVFATPKYCTSRTCGPVVDVVDTVRRRLAGRDVRFIHVEIFRGNDPALGKNRFVREWRLPSEPWTFLVGRDGRIKAKFEGSLSVGELTSAVERFLV
jgi:hypothetical protein